MSLGIYTILVLMWFQDELPELEEEKPSKIQEVS